MEFRTLVEIPEYPFRIGHEQQGLLVGSCFAASVGERLAQVKMPVAVNPFGVVYNPASIVRTLEMLETGKPADEAVLHEHNNLWFAFSHHSAFSSTHKTEAIEHINESIKKGHSALHQAGYLILTLGTAWVYEWAETGEIVNNCHKLPARNFKRRRLSADEIVREFERMLDKPLYQGKKIILTVSPIRHLKDGLIENQFSKATLLVAVHRLVEKFDHVYYFPSYEILMDDLRDYRFYERDMVHPSATAVDYIWERFCRTLVNEESRKLFGRIEKINAARAHRPFNPDAPQHQAFKNAMFAEIIELKGQYPYLDFSEESTYFSE